jgi:hypothetical protein
MAIAWSLLVTFPPLPDFKVPLLNFPISWCITRCLHDDDDDDDLDLDDLDLGVDLRLGLRRRVWLFFGILWYL